MSAVFDVEQSTIRKIEKFRYDIYSKYRAHTQKENRRHGEQRSGRKP
jgi:hypothetical protein